MVIELFAKEMRPRLFLAFTVTLLFGIALGVIGRNFLVNMKAYANVSAIAAQGSSILARIEGYKDANGKAPDQQWFDELGETTKTKEGYQWIYHNPPKMLSKERRLVIMTATRSGSNYLGGFSDGTVIFTDLKTTKESEQAGHGDGE